MSKGPNKIVLLPDDLMFVVPKGSIFTSKVNASLDWNSLANVPSLSSGRFAKRTPRTEQRLHTKWRHSSWKNRSIQRSYLSLSSLDKRGICILSIQGDLVAVKRLHIGPLSMRTKVMRELKQLKDLRHENVNTFIGLFIDPNEPALIFEYGMRGSLEVRIPMSLAGSMTLTLCLFRIS